MDHEKRREGFGARGKGLGGRFEEERRVKIVRG